MRLSKWQQLIEFIIIHETIAYEDTLKKKFQTLGRAALRDLVKKLYESGKVVNCKIDYNKGGIAVSGDFHLRGDFVDGGSFDFFFNMDGFNRFFTYRRTKNQKDYTGDVNLNIPFVDATVEKVADRIVLLAPKKPVGEIIFAHITN